MEDTCRGPPCRIFTLARRNPDANRRSRPRDNRWRFTVKHTGSYIGYDPSGKTAIWTGVEIDRIADGKIIESWVDWDKFRQLEMLGILV
ncbi:MAG: ester cyclase [Hyphomicrobiales bacterium]|nr:ester cyclase [Hyphomicrobiales bacterium]MCP5001463.1 ester cyclase [Hyphomicrobiales bacterium]